jgi:hypothetical protein
MLIVVQAMLCLSLPSAARAQSDPGGFVPTDLSHYPSSVSVGQTFSLDYTVKNTGADLDLAPVCCAWYHYTNDRVYLSTDDVLSSDDLLVGTSGFHGGFLPNGGTYTETMSDAVAPNVPRVTTT